MLVVCCRWALGTKPSCARPCHALHNPLTHNRQWQQRRLPQLLAITCFLPDHGGRREPPPRTHHTGVNNQAATQQHEPRSTKAAYPASHPHVDV